MLRSLVQLRLLAPKDEMKIVLEDASDCFAVFSTKLNLNRDDICVDDCVELCEIDKDENAYAAVTKLLKALKIPYKEV